MLILEPLNARSMLDAAGDGTGQPRIERRRRLTPEALAIASQKVRRAYSSVIITGIVRIVDFALLSVIGIALYAAYVARIDGFLWEYVAAIVAMAVAAVICFQAADIYQVQIFRGHLKQNTRMVSAWAFVFLLFIGISFFAKLGGAVSRVWLSSFFIVGLLALVGERAVLRMLIKRWAHQGRLDRRRRRQRREPDPGAERPGRQ
jgi:MFS family permease